MPFNWVPNQDTDVYSLDGHLVGQVAEAWPSEYSSSRALASAIGEQGMGYFRMTGFKGGDLFVPVSALADYADERVRLKVTKKLIARQGWERRPAGLTGE
jgi:hypothetical protein